jgi:hypothetical protein
MICPQCRAEYRSGFTVCADCGVPLLESSELVEPSVAEGGAGRQHVTGTPGDPNSDPFCSFWKGTDLRVCTEICTVLDEAGIPHKLIRRQDYVFNLSHQSPYEIGVPASLYEKAEVTITDAFGMDEETGDDAIRLLPAPEAPEPDVDAPVKQERDASGWYPEDATAEAWEGEPAEAREMIEMSLQENDIRMRWEIQDGKPRLFVLPVDEERATEIVREVVEGQPPE